MFSYVACLAMVIELDAPAPFLVVGGVPPVLQGADFAAGKDDGRAIVGLGGPDVLAGDRVSLEAEARDWAADCAPQVLAARQQFPVVAAHFNIKLLRRGMDQQHVGGIQPSARKRNAGWADISNPEVPDVQCVLSHSWPLSLFVLFSLGV